MPLKLLTTSWLPHFYSAPPAASAFNCYAAGVHVPMYGGDSLYDGVIASTAKQRR